ncbi:hypothetical protein [Legionella spiritensis]|nr:hypothetical protein [Legionella spiritensis]
MRVVMLIADSKKSLSQFILDLCGFTLDNAQVSSETYAFHLHIAFRRQTILQADKWDELCQAVSSKPLYWEDPLSTSLQRELNDFAQSIVDEVVRAKADPWAIKLLKTGYLSNLDKARKNSELAIKKLMNTPIDQSIYRGPIEDPSLEKYVEALKAHITYLDSLLALPFVLEKFCIRMAENKGVNYLPKKSTEMLTAILDTMDQAIGAEGVASGISIEALKIAVQITMPELPIDGELIDTISRELLPFLNQVIENNQLLERCKKNIFPAKNPEMSRARQELLASMGVHFDSLQSIVENTLLQPIQECANLAAGVEGLAYETIDVIRKDNIVDRMEGIGKMFSNLEQIVGVSESLDSDLLPPWLLEARKYYEQLRKVNGVVEKTAAAVNQGFGIFYNGVAYFIPESVRQYFNEPDSYRKVLSTIARGKSEVRVESILAYLSFFELAKAGGIYDPLDSFDALRERFFYAYMGELQKTTEGLSVDYKKYKKLEEFFADIKLEKPLAERIEAFATSAFDSEDALPKSLRGAVAPAQFDMLVMIHRLKDLEAAFDDDTEIDIARQELALKELTAALAMVKEVGNESITAFGNEFLQPAAERVLLRFMQRQFIPLLEQVIDRPEPKIRVNKAYVKNLSDIYSKLKSGVLLSSKEFRQLKDCFGDSDEFVAIKPPFDVAKSLKTALNGFSSGKAKAPAWEICETPHQKLIATIKHSLHTVKPVLEQISSGLERQLDACKLLQELSEEGSDLSRLCANKIKYIEVLKAKLDELSFSIENYPDQFAQGIESLLNGEDLEKARKNLTDMSMLSLPGKLVRFAWHVWPSESDNFDSHFLDNLLTYYLKDTDLGVIYEAQQQFVNDLNDHPVPELMPVLSDPLALANIMPRQEEIMDELVNQLIGLGTGGESLWDWSQNFVNKAALDLIGNIDKNTVVKLFPYPFLGEIAFQVFQSGPSKALLAGALESLQKKYGGIVADKAEEVVEAARNRLYPLLGIEIQKSVEAGAYEYAMAENRGDVAPEKRDAFAMYYLQYRAIKQRNPEMKTDECLRFLFKALLDHPEEEGGSESKIDDLVRAFEDFDKELFKKEHKADQLEETNNQLQFLISNLDFSDPGNDMVIRMALINRFLLMAFDASEKLGTGMRDELQQQGLELLSRVLQQMEMTKPEDKEDETVSIHDAGLDESFIVLHPKSTTPATLMRNLKPAHETASRLYLQRLQEVLGSTQTRIGQAFSERERRLEDNEQERQLGRTVAAVEYDKSKNNYPRLIYKIGAMLYEGISLVAFWASVIAPLLAGGGVTQALFTALGIAGAVGSAASVYGLVALAVVAAIRFTVKLGFEIWYHRKEFNDIANNRDYSVPKKIGLITLVTLKCIGLAALKTVFTDYLVAKATTLLALVPLKRIREAIKVYPSEEAITTEKAVLDTLKTRLQTMKRLVDEQLNHPEAMLPEDLEQAYAELEEAMDDARDELDRQLSFNDVRNTEAYRNTRNDYKAAYEHIKNLYQSLKTINEIGQSIHEDEPAPERIGNRVDKGKGKLPIEVLPEQPSLDANGRVDMAAYYAKTHPSVAAESSKGYGTYLVSGFFRLVAGAGCLFGRSSPEEGSAKMDIMSQSVGKSIDLMSSSFILMERESTIPVSDEHERLMDSMVDFDEAIKSFVMIPGPHEYSGSLASSRNGFFSRPENIIQSKQPVVEASDELKRTNPSQENSLF